MYSGIIFLLDRNMKFTLLKNNMQDRKTFYTSDRKIWRQWLQDNYQIEKEIWFILPTKDSKDKSLSYNDAVEEALCFGWIDSTAWKVDDTHGSRRFTPRKKGSPYSRPNIERLVWLNDQGLLLPEIKESVKDLIKAPYVFPEDIINEIKKDEETYKNYLSFTDSYKRIRIDYIDQARDRKEEFNKRLNSFLSKTKENKLIIGFGGIDKYYK